MKWLQRIHWPSFFGLLVAAGLLIALWDTWLITPFKVLVVFFHELSHGLAAVLTGGEIVRIEIVAQQGGACITRGGNRFLILSAGYLGSMLWGGTILVLTRRARVDRWLAIALGATLVLVSLLWVRPVFGFGFAFVLVFGAALIGVGWKLPATVNDAVLGLIGLVSCLYPIADIKSDVLDRPHLLSDAAMLGTMTFIPGPVWGVFWIGIALVVGLASLALSCSKPKEPVPARTHTAVPGERQSRSSTHIRPPLLCDPR